MDTTGITPVMPIGGAGDGFNGSWIFLFAILALLWGGNGAFGGGNDIRFTNFNEYDWNYVMNMMYSDYYGAVPNDVNSYIRLAVKFLEDKDAKEGKAYCYYMAMKK